MIIEVLGNVINTENIVCISGIKKHQHYEHCYYFFDVSVKHGDSIRFGTYVNHYNDKFVYDPNNTYNDDFWKTKNEEIIEDLLYEEVNNARNKLIGFWMANIKQYFDSTLHCINYNAIPKIVKIESDEMSLATILIENPKNISELIPNIQNEQK